MSVDTYLIVPSRVPKHASRILDPEGSETTTIGTDYIVLYRPDRFSDIENNIERYGCEFAAQLPHRIRKELDPRGIAAYPEVGQSFTDGSYGALVTNHGSPLWLPTKRARKKTRRRVKVLLVPMSPAREKILIADPALVKGLVERYVAGGVSECLEIEHWIELQRTLLDAMMLNGSAEDDRRAYAVAPCAGLPLYEDKTIDSAKFVTAARVTAIAEWLTSLPPSVVTSVYSIKERGHGALAFPNSLGTVPTDDDDDSRPHAERRPTLVVVQKAFDRLVDFYGKLRRRNLGVLSIRFRCAKRGMALHL